MDVQIHDEYDMFRFRNDIALLRVDPPFDFNSKVQSIALPSSGHRASGMAYASGWGLMQEGKVVLTCKSDYPRYFIPHKLYYSTYVIATELVI